MARVEVYKRQYIEAMKRAFIELQPELVKRFTGEVVAEKWTWPRPPSPRDIVDTGRLRDSLNNPSQTGPRTPPVEEIGGRLVAMHIWHVPYAVFVHEGYTLRNGFVGPARPWTETAIKSFDPRAFMREVVHEQLKRMGL